jgi:preprotein translocase subunit SecG
MSILVILLRIVEVLVCLLLIGVILLQRTKGSGAGVSFGGGMAESVFGAQMGNVLTKATVILGIVFLVNTIFLSILAAKQSGQADGSLMGNEAPAPVAAPATAGRESPAAPEGTPAAAAASVLDDVPRADAPAASDAPAPAPAQ